MHIQRFFAGHVGDWIILVTAVVLVAVGTLFGYAHIATAPTPEKSDAVAAFVTDFGDQIVQVPLRGTKAEAAEAMEALYPPYVSRPLLDSWKENPSTAPGRRTAHGETTSLRVSSVKNVGIGSYVVRAYIVETPDAAPDNAREMRVTFGIKQDGSSWKIVEYSVASST